MRLTGQRSPDRRGAGRGARPPGRAGAAPARGGPRREESSLATVYRTVKRFEEAGILERHAFRDGRARYEAAPDSHHDHLIDLDTGKVIEFRSEEIERLQAEIARRLGYDLVGHRLELYAHPARRRGKRTES